MKKVGGDARPSYSKTIEDSDMKTAFSEAGGARSLGLTGEVLSRKDRLQVFGIDCTGPFGDGIIFKGGEWIPGGEYVQRLRVKNVSSKLKKLKYRCPKTKYFSMAYPEIITLSPGTVKEVDVVFRPEVCEVYDDVVLFKALDGPNAGGFNVPVRALLPTLQVTIPEGLDFGYCQTGDVSGRVFHVKNTGEVPAPFLWDVPPPFTISPSEGIVAVGESKAVTCFVKPVDASVFVSQAVLRVGEGVNAIKPTPLLEMKVSAVGKYCYVVPSEEELDFGNQIIPTLGVGTVDNQRYPRLDFTLRNQSVVPASFVIRRVEGDRDAVFSMNPSKGVIPPEDEMLITVTYSPTSVGTFSRDHYEVVTVGGNKVTVGIQGRAVGCSVRLRKKEDPFARLKGYGVPDSVNFREVKVGVTTTRVIYLLNESSTPCRYCFAVQGDASIFRFSSTKGIIPSSGSEHPGEAQVTVTFTPMKPTNYYRRIFCLLENQQPLLLDVMGTGYVVAKGEVQEQRPAPLRHAHVQAFRNREGMGLGRCSPQELEKLLEAEGMSDLFAKVGPEGTPPLRRCKVARPLTRSGETSRLQTAVAAEFFVDPTDPAFNPVYLEHSNMDFGFAQAGAERITTLTNNSSTDVHVVWNLRSSADDMVCSGLEITPLEADVPAGESFSFRVCLVPTKSNRYFSEDAEAFVSPVNQMTFGTVNDATQQPPWYLPLRVHGHSFIGGQFIAKGSLSTQHTGQKLSFPACHVGDSVYQTIRLSNQGNIPAFFSFQPDSTGAFSTKPAAGVIPAGDFQLCLVRFTPRGTGAHHHRLSCVLNNDRGSTLEAELFGQGAMPSIQTICAGWEGEQRDTLSTSATSSVSSMGIDRDVIYLRPTCVGLVYSGIFKIKNTSRIPAIFIIEPPKASSGVLRVSPLAGLLLGNQTATVKLAFAPREARRYQFRLVTKARIVLAHSRVTLVFCDTPMYLRAVHALEGIHPVEGSEVRSISGDTPHLTDCRQLGTPSPAVVSPGAYVTIIGQGEQGAVSFNPDTLKYSELLANTTESKELMLENHSACDVTYKLFYVANKEPLSRHCSRESIVSGDGSRGKDRGLRPVLKENGEAKRRGGLNHEEVFFVDRPEGTLPARSRTRTIATFRPVLEGNYDFGVVCQVSTANETGDMNIISPIEVEMAEQGHKARVASALLCEDDLGKGESMFEELGEGKKLPEAHGSAIAGIMPLQCSIQGRASFPIVVFRDLRMTRAGGGDIPGASPRNLWSALSLTQLNSMLRKPLTKEEISFNKQLTPDTSQLRRFDVPFVPAVIGSGAVILTLQIYNPGFLTASMSLNLPNTKSVEMETWANEGEPTEEELRQNDIIDTNMFAFAPDPGTVIEVSAGECQRVTISYSADSLSYGGVHNLPLLVRIAEGRQFWLDLKGTTLPPGYPMLYVPTGLERQYVLEPVAVGTPLVEAPMQTTQLLNVGDAAVSYRVDRHAIKSANEDQGHGVSVFRLEEETGTIQGGSSELLRWRFLPLETKEYVVKVTVRTEKPFEGGPKEQSLDIILRGVGYDPRKRDPHSQKLPDMDLGLEHPSRQLEIPRAQYCVLSTERIRLGRIPQGVVLSRVVSIRNCLAATSIDFSWDPEDTEMETYLQGSSVVCINPSKGTLGAGQSALLQVCISATCGPCFLGQHPVNCIVRPVPPTPAPCSRKPKFQLQSRLEQKRQARARPSNPRVPVVSRPTASRSLHMAEVAKDFYERRLTDNCGMVLCPHYPTSTVNAQVPRVLAAALETVHSKGVIQEGGEIFSSRGSNDCDKGQLEMRSCLDGATIGDKLSEGLGQGASSTNQRTGLGNSRGRPECYSEEKLTVPVDGGTCILPLVVEGEVVCYETYQELFGSRVDADPGGHFSEDRSGGDIGVRGNDNGTMTDTFFIPRPTKYEADWPSTGLVAGRRGELGGGYDSSRRDGEVSSTHLPTSKRGVSTDVQLLARGCQDTCAEEVVSRVLKRFVGDVVVTDGIRRCFTTLPITQRVPQFKEISPTLPLPDRLARALTPHLQGGFVHQFPPHPPTASAAAVTVQPSLDLNRQRINRNTRLKKKDLLLAIRAAGSRGLSAESITEPNAEHGQAEETTLGTGCILQQRGPLARLAAVVEMCSSREVILADLVSTLDNATIHSLEKWLDRGDVFSQNKTPTSHKKPDTAVGGSPALVTNGTTLVGERSDVQDLAGGTSEELPDPSESVVEATRTHLENEAAVTIQAQVRRLQAVGATKNAAEERHSRLVDEACMNPEIQRILATALEGTFFHLMQEAVNGEFDLSKRPTRFAIRNAVPRHGRRSADPTAVRGNADATEPETDAPPVISSRSLQEDESTAKAVTTEVEGEPAPAMAAIAARVDS